MPARFSSVASTSALSRGLTLVAAALALACGRDPSGVEGVDHLEGLQQAVATDSGGSPVANPGHGAPGPGLDTAAGNPGLPNDGTPGYAHGVVRASEVVQGPDTLVNSVRIANVRVAAYPITDWSSTAPQPNTGPVAAETVTNANGEFQLAEVPGGHYVVTFTPTAGSKYQGVWVTTTINATTKDWPWWVTLPDK